MSRQWGNPHNNLLKIVKESGIGFSGALIGTILAYFWLIILTRALNPKEFGTFSLAESIINVSLIFVLIGMPKALNRFIPYYNAEGNQGKIKTLIYNIVKITSFLSIIIGFIIYINSEYLATKIFENINLSLTLKIMALSIPLLTFIRVVSFSFIGYKELRYQVYFQRISIPVTKIIFASIVLIFGLGLIGWTWLYILSLGITSLFSFYFFKKKIISILSKVVKQPISFKKIFSYSWPLSMNDILLLTSGQISLIFLGAFSSASDVGSFRIYIYIVSFLGIVLHSFTQIYKPVISELISKDKLEEVKQNYKRVSKWIFLINAFVFLVILIFGTNITTLIFTKKYLTAPTALVILAAGRFVNSAVGPTGMNLEAFGNTRYLMMNSLIMVILNLVLAYLLIPPLGIVGAAIATSVSHSIVSMIALGENYFLYRLHPFTNDYLKYIFICLGISGIIFLIKMQLQIKLNTLILMISLLFGTYFFSLYIFRCFDKTDYKVLSQIKAKFIKN